MAAATLRPAPLAQVGFQRFQVNATSANGVDTSVFGTAEGARRCVAALRTAFASLTQVEFIMQRNSETRPLWELLVAEMPPNVSLLFDDSMGLGKCRCRPRALAPRFSPPFALRSSCAPLALLSAPLAIADNSRVPPRLQTTHTHHAPPHPLA